MNNITILPADTFIVVNKTITNDKDRKIISTLYQPIIGSLATSLYFTLWSDLDSQEIMSMSYTHHHLMANLKSKLDDIIEARKVLEAVGLLRTYFKKQEINNYIYELYSPLSPSDFLNHPILSTFLENNIGEKEYKKIIEYYKNINISLDEYKEITEVFSNIFECKSKDINNINDIKKSNINDIIIEKDFDFNLLLESIPKGIINIKSFNNDSKNLIINLSYIYNLDVKEMIPLVINSIKDNGIVDKNLLKKNVKNYYEFENKNKQLFLLYRKHPESLKTEGGLGARAKMIYIFENVTPYNFLKARNNGAKPASRDLNIIESLLTDFKLSPGVVNVLIDYTLKINDKKLNKNFLETIASHWKRLNIKTVEEAMLLCEKEHKKYDKEKVHTKKEEEKLPEWFDKNIEVKKVNKEEEDELKNILKEFM
ncbi:MAG TPA: DnaD domain protein [Bacilli bacterium]|nr:DnaD domain protein [Bacilli bacterium]